MSVPAFTQAVPDNGYQWWYLDAVSDDGKHALTVIVFIGSVFSPYYAWARKRGSAQAAQHCSINVALYGNPSRWCMTERTDNSLQADDHCLCLGKSLIKVVDSTIVINIDEISVPIPSRLTGTLTLELPDYDLDPQPLDHEEPAQAEHFWQPIAPHTRIKVEMSSPRLKWQGNAYVDSNRGSSPLESSFKSWTWSRSHSALGDTTVLYDVIMRDGRRAERSLKFNPSGQLEKTRAPTRCKLQPTRYFRISRSARTGENVRIEALQTLEDTPFYARSRFTEVDTAPTSGHTAKAGTDHATTGQRITVHESLNLDRFDSAWVRCLLPFRMPRNTRAVLPG